MVVHSVRYRFRQPFQAPASAAFAWCVDFRPSDAALLSGWKSRSVEWLTDDALILTDVSATDGKPVRIHRLVRIDPSKLSWTNTHVDGPHRHSQFWYHVVPDGPRRSHLEFEALEILYRSHALSAKQIAELSAAERKGDSKVWRTGLAPALNADLSGSPSRRASRSKGPAVRR
jgi:hypothetical protein